MSVLASVLLTFIVTMMFISTFLIRGKYNNYERGFLAILMIYGFWYSNHVLTDFTPTICSIVGPAN